MKDYEVIGESNRSALVNAVRLMMKQGWIPQGGISVTHNHADGYMFHQAMVKLN